MKNKQARKTIPSNIVVYDDKKESFITYLCYIDKWVQKGQKIPARVIKKLMTFVEFEEDYKKEFVKAEILDKIDNIFYPYFLKSNYDFSVKKDEAAEDFYMIDENITTKVVEYNLKGMLVYILEHIYDEYDLNKKFKIKAGIYLLNLFTIKFQIILSKIVKCEVELSKYQKYVITAYIVLHFGFGLSEKEEMTNQDLYQSVRAVLDKVKKKD